MGKMMTQEEFQRIMKKNFGDEYDFSETIYKGGDEYVTYRCYKHGLITTKAKNLLNKQRCSQCAHTAKLSLVCGWGVNDYNGLVKIDGVFIESYNRWCGILERCLCVKREEKHPTYADCSVCEEWKYFSKFKEWFDNPANGYIDGYHIDKDLFSKGSKTYSPETCCFLPAEINSALIKNKRKMGKYPTGVQYIKSRNKYKASVKFKNQKIKMLGYFDAAEEAFNAYKKEKKEYLKFLADKYYSKGLITERVYDALYNYEVMEDD